MNRGRAGLYFAVLVAALGYFVDLYDIVIFGVVRVASLKSIGLEGQAITDWAVNLFNIQMGGMVLGGVVWGLVADRFGRRFALFATIALFSLANIANAYVATIEQYAAMRFLAGFGLAGELGIGVTLVSEALDIGKRGYGTTIIAFLGLVGALTAAFVGKNFEWRTAYQVSGGLGLLVLAGRFLGVEESRIFEGKAEPKQLRDVAVLLRPDLLLKLAAEIALGVPIWFVSTMFVTYAPEVGKALGLSEPLNVGIVLKWQATGLAAGAALTGLVSEYLGSRKRVLAGCFVGMSLMLAVLLNLHGLTAGAYSIAMLCMGLMQGYWTPFVTLAAEQFGTNVRATVATSVPNFVRFIGTVLAGWTLTNAASSLPIMAGAIGAAILLLAFAGLVPLEETYGRDLDYREPLSAAEARRLVQERRAARAAAVR